MDMDGSDAFDRVFEKALELNETLTRQRLTISDRDAELFRVKDEIKESRRLSGCASAEAGRSGKLQEALDKVWRAAKAAADGKDVSFDALKVALDQTESLVDPIPF